MYDFMTESQILQKAKELRNAKKQKQPARIIKKLDRELEKLMYPKGLL